MIQFLRLTTIALVLSATALAGLGMQPAAADEFYIEVTPQSASGRVGTTHTVTATPDYESGGEGEVLFTFRVIEGPNYGASSAFGGCVPASCVGGTNHVVHPVSWTYTGVGGVGTDLIEVCALDRSGKILDCKRVTMTWFREGAFPIGGAISAQAAENRARAAAAAQPAAVLPPSTGTGIITPPSTGDAGLLGSSSSSWTLFTLAGMAAFALAGLATLKFARR